MSYSRSSSYVFYAKSSFVKWLLLLNKHTGVKSRMKWKHSDKKYSRCILITITSWSVGMCCGNYGEFQQTSSGSSIRFSRRVRLALKCFIWSLSYTAAVRILAGKIYCNCRWRRIFLYSRKLKKYLWKLPIQLPTFHLFGLS